MLTQQSTLCTKEGMMVRDQHRELQPFCEVLLTPELHTSMSLMPTRYLLAVSACIYFMSIMPLNCMAQQLVIHLASTPLTPSAVLQPHYQAGLCNTSPSVGAWRPGNRAHGSHSCIKFSPEHTRSSQHSPAQLPSAQLQLVTCLCSDAAGHFSRLARSRLTATLTERMLFLIPLLTFPLGNKSSPHHLSSSAPSHSLPSQPCKHRWPCIIAVQC